MLHRLPIGLPGIACALFLFALSLSPALAHAQAQEGLLLRLYQGATAYIANPQGVAFDVSVDVRQWHLLENGPRELLFKLSDPDGKVIERKLVEDDGVKGNAFLPEAGGWDHEMWYYTMLYSRGTQPMIRWSAFSDAGRVAALPGRTFKVSIPAGKKGVYRVLLAGSRDHVATLKISGGLKAGVAGHTLFLHGHDDVFNRSVVYVPRGTIGMNIGFAEFDQPVTRRFKVTAPDGTVLWDAPARGGFQSTYIKDLTDKYDDQLLTVEVTTPNARPGKATRPGDYLMHLQFTRNDVKIYRGGPGVPAIFCPDAETAKLIQGGAIYHDGLVFWHGFQVRLHDWIKEHIKPDDLIVRDAQGNEIKPTEGKAYGWGAKALEYKGLPEAPGFVPLNGPHEPPPLCDSLMHNYTAHKNRAILNVSLLSLETGLRTIGVGDHPVIPKFGGNLGYVFGTYGWHYWRPAWRIMQQSDAPQELKDILREAILLCGDRLAMSAGQERTNGNAMSHVPMALRYAAEGVQDPLLTKMADTYFERFSTEGWGRGAGISRSGDCQEHFAHDFHYGSYIHANFTAVVNDLKDPRFKAVLDRISGLYAYLYCPEVPAYPWGSRTAQPAGVGAKEWKGLGGPDFTESVNGGDEWFAARRPTYYALTFHGRLCPEWLNNYFATRLGYGGGTLCQLTVPGRGVVLAGTLNGSYGKDMQRNKWPDFHIHSIFGTMADGQPLVAADSEHLDARLEGTTVSGGGEVRDRPIHSSRSYKFNDDSIVVSAALSDTDYREALWSQGPSSKIAEAYEMIPYLAGDPKKTPTIVQGVSPEGKAADLTGQPQTVSAVVIDRGGYGVKIEFDRARPVKLGNQSTVLVQLIEGVVGPEKVNIEYTLRPFIGAAPGVVETGPAATPLPRVAALDAADKVAPALQGVEARTIKLGDKAIATVRFAMSGPNLAVSADVVDRNVRRAPLTWEGSEFELYASPIGKATIRQIFFVPAVGKDPAAALVTDGKGQKPAPGVLVHSETTPTGYRLSALVPIQTLGLAVDAKEVFLEALATSAAGPEPANKRGYATLFGSRLAYENNRLFARFEIPRE